MTTILATNILTPLGRTTRENYEAVRAGKSALAVAPARAGLPLRHCAAAFSGQQWAEMAVEGLTRFESLALRSLQDALSRTAVDPSSGRTVLILSTTKGNVEELGPEPARDGAYGAPGEAARKIAARLGMRTTPIVVCNACISGVAAQVLADRLLSAGEYDSALVCGADTLSDFVLAGFHSLKALSPLPCRPFDWERNGLNLGEGAATMILGRKGETDAWTLRASALTNDAYHVSAPAPDGEGVRRAIVRTMEGEEPGTLATIAVHGTATLFNDQMESKAIERAGLSDVPVSSYKAVFGHTLGAAGLIESILALQAAQDGVVLGAKGFEASGVSGKINISSQERRTDKTAVLKIISGFGGCNAALLYDRQPSGKTVSPEPLSPTAASGKEASPRVTARVQISPQGLWVNGERRSLRQEGAALLTEIYKTCLDDNPKFYKMDLFSRVAYLASAMLLREEKEVEEMPFILFNRSSSVLADRHHLRSCNGPEGFFPSPSVFVYTLPNVVMGDLAVHYGLKGETTLLILPEKDEALMERITGSVFTQTGARMMLTGWADAADETCFEADMKIIQINQ